jgi:hydroxymethylglutaryl-CoA lyase
VSVDKGIIQLVECPRDAMQGLHNFVPTALKVAYLRELLKAGFDTLDCGSFVSPDAVPQLADTATVLENIEGDVTNTKLLVIIANERGAKAAALFKQVQFLGFPFSISEKFQLRNTNTTREEALKRLQTINEIAVSSQKDCVAYLSMGFGNPYGEPYSREEALAWAERIIALGIRYISLSDTIGAAKPEDIAYLFNNLIKRFPEVTFGAHFHSSPGAWKDKVDAALENGCRRFDGAIKGFGGCPFAKDELTGNLPTEELVDYFEALGWRTSVNKEMLNKAISASALIFNEGLDSIR